MKIRRAVLDDAQGIAEIVRELGWFDYLTGEDPEQTIERVRGNMARALAEPCHSLYVAVDSGDQPAAYASVHWLPNFMLTGPEGYLSDLFVRREFRGQGLGSRLLEVVKKEAEEKGCCRLMLINSRNRDSYQRGFYKSRGWEERPQVANFVLKL